MQYQKQQVRCRFLEVYSRNNVLMQWVDVIRCRSPLQYSYNTEDHYSNVFVTHNVHFLYAIENLGTA